jgi:two-component system, sensor histidine kinase and response regulator
MIQIPQRPPGNVSSKVNSAMDRLPPRVDLHVVEGLPATKRLGARNKVSATKYEAVTHQDDDLANVPVFAPLHVLVADDGASNRAFAISLLENRGHSCTLAVTGRQAVEHFSRFVFDAVLMDLEMPDMDGIQATGAIRALPHGRDVPIIAMTTQADDADRRRCRDAGMTEFVSKPFSARDMVIILEQAVAKVRLERISRLLHVLPESELMPPSSTASPGTAVIINLTLARQRLGNDEQLLRDMAGFYIEDAPTLMSDLRSALQNGDVELATRSAHSIKGLSSNFDANQAVRAAIAIEDASRAGDLAAAGTRVDDLDAEIGRVIHALKADVLGVS